MSADYSGLTRNNWTGTWSPTGSFPIVLDTEIRGGLHSISGGSNDKLTDITGQRLVEGMLVYLKAGYTASGFTRASNSYFTYKLLAGQSRDANTGTVPNAEANWTVSEIGSSVTVVDSVADGNANAVSSNAVFDALADKAPLASPNFSGTSNFSGGIILNGESSSISTFGVGGFIATDGDTADIFTNGTASSIHTSGINATIYTTGTNAEIYTEGANAHIQTGATFKLFNGTHTTTLSHNPIANRTIAFPDASGTVPVYTAAPSGSGKVLTSDGVLGAAVWADPAAGGTVDTTITDGSLNAVSSNAVFDALANKAPNDNPTFTETAVINTVGVGKNSLTINNASNGDGTETYGLKINKSGIYSIGLQVDMPQAVENGVGILANVVGGTSIGLVASASGDGAYGAVINGGGSGSKGASINSSDPYDSTGLSVASYGIESTGVQVAAYGAEAVGLRINSPSGVYQAIFGSTGTDRSFVARLRGAFGWFRGNFTARIHPPDTITDDRTYTFPDASGTVPVSTGVPTVTGQVLTSSGTQGLATWVSATSANTANTLVKRDAGGSASFTGIGLYDVDGGVLSNLYVTDATYSFGSYIELSANNRTLMFLSTSLGASPKYYTFPDASGTVPVFFNLPTVTGQVLTSSGTNGAATWSGLVYTGTGNTGVLKTGGGLIAINSLPADTIGGLRASNIGIGFEPFIPINNASPSNNVHGNIGIGDKSLTLLDSSAGFSTNNIAIGSYAARNLTDCQSSIFIGTYAGIDLINNSSGSTIIGDAAGVYYGVGTSNVLTQADKCTFLGRLTKGSTAASINQIVIGNNAIGDQNNSTVIGNTDTTQTRLAGNTLKLGSATLNTSVIQTATGTSKTITLPNVTGTVPVYTGEAAVGKVLTSSGTNGVATWQDAATGTGTISNVSVTTANGVSGLVDNSSPTTPAITLTLGDITPSKVNGLTITAGTGTGTLTVTGTASVSGANTGDQTAASIGLGNVTNESKTAMFTSPAFTGIPTAPTADASVSNTQIATTAYVGTAVANLVDSAPATLNTLNELAAALGDNASFSTTIATALSLKINSDLTGVSGGTQLTNIIQITQSGYNSITIPSSSTLYVIVG